MKKIIAAILVLGGGAGVQAQSPETVMERAVKGYTDMRSMRADFRQTITNPLTGTSFVSHGVLLRKDPNLLSITFSDPKGDRVVSDGSSVWVYLPSSAPGQVIKMPAGGTSMGMVDPGGLFLSSPASRYAISAGGTGTVSGRKTTVLNLIPKRANSAFSRAKVWVDASDYTIRQFEIVDANGLTRVVTISNVRPNAAIGSREFQFSPPKNDRVIDGGM